jgi:carbon storage regulator CsrA
MLVLSRRNGEQVLILEHGIVITVLEARSGKVRLGFTAPKHIKVLRRELHEPCTPVAANEFANEGET